MTVQSYFEKVPKLFLDFIDEKKNCEDIAMAHMVTQQVMAPKDWTIFAAIFLLVDKVQE